MSHRQPITGRSEPDIAARHADVIGDGPRIAPVPNDEVDPESRAIVNAIRASAGAGPAAIMPEYMRVVIKHPEIFRCQMDMGTALFTGRIPARERELAVLRAAWLCGAPYEWSAHVDIARKVGMDAAEFERVTVGAAAAGWSDHDRAIIRGVEELVGDHMISDETWAALARSWDERQLIEFPALVGNYITVALIQNSLRIRLNEGSLGLMER